MTFNSFFEICELNLTLKNVVQKSASLVNEFNFRDLFVVMRRLKSFVKWFKKKLNSVSKFTMSFATKSCLKSILTMREMRKQWNSFNLWLKRRVKFAWENWVKTNFEKLVLKMKWYYFFAWSTFSQIIQALNCIFWLNFSKIISSLTLSKFWLKLKLKWSFLLFDFLSKLFVLS